MKSSSIGDGECYWLKEVEMGGVIGFGGFLFFFLLMSVGEIGVVLRVDLGKFMWLVRDIIG